MKRHIVFVLTICLTLGLCACGQKAPTWQEQYDLGVRYLSEGNYEEAIIAFTAAIEIDPKNAEAYIGLADVYIQQGEYEKAREILEQGFEITQAQEIVNKLNELDSYRQAEDGFNFTGMLEPSETVSYADIPAIFSMNYIDCCRQFGVDTDWLIQSESSGSFDGGDYSLPCNIYAQDGVYIEVPIGSDHVSCIDIDDWVTGMNDGLDTGWRNISIGDDYATVLGKLGLDASILETYKGIWLDLYDDSTYRGYAEKESGVTYNGIMTPQIGVTFYSGSSQFGKHVCLEFHEGNTLNRIFYENWDLLGSLI